LTAVEKAQRQEMKQALKLKENAAWMDFQYKVPEIV
jgi:hypothetical protein